MARMSIDDMFLRDPRVLKLARRLGWSKYEVRGRLLDVYALVYDRVDADAGELVTDDDIDIAADFPGLAEGMVQEDLAVRVRDRVRVCGATERTKYLSTRETSGRAGGLKSGETRRNKAKVQAKVQAKVTFEKNEGRSNPSVPDPVPDLVPDPGDQTLAPARAIPPSTKPVPPPAARAADPATPQRSIAAGILAATSWQRQSAWWGAMLEAHDRLRKGGIKPGTPDLPKNFMGYERELGACARFFVEAGYDDAGVDEKMRHVVLVAEAEATREGHLDWFKPSLLWSVDRVKRAADTTLEEARRGTARGRAPAKSSEPREIQVRRDRDESVAAIPKWHGGGS